MSVKYHLRTLGEPALMTPAGRPTPFRTRKALGLLAFLAVEPRLHDREALAEMLWSRAGGAEARHSLSNAISEIRHRLGRLAVEAVGERIRLRPDVVQVDLQRLVAGRILATDTEPQLEVDGFLEEFELPDAIGFSHWRESRRAGLLGPLRDALVILIDRARRTGDFPALGRLGDRLVRFDEMSEDAVRARMESRAFAGDRLGALRLFEEWKVELAAQFGAVPSALLDGMALRLRRRGWERPDGVDVPAVRMDHWRDRPFVGRGPQYQELYEAWESTRRGEPRHRLLLGDSGIGKSTLVERITSVAALEGATVVRTQCHEAERELPYAAATELITQLVTRSGASATPPEQLAELAQHIPAVRRRFAELPAPLATQGEAARVRFSEATHALMLAVAGEHPLLVVVDDVHNADDVSLAVLHYVLRHEPDQPLQMLFVGRPGELRRSPNAARLLDQGQSIGIATLVLPPLTPDEGTELLDRLLADGEDPGVGTRRALVTASAGYPLVLELLLRDWRQSGNAALALQLDAIVAVPERREGPMETYRLVLDRVFGGLEPDTRTVLHTAAILGSHLNEPAMFALADVTASQMMHGLAKLTELRVLRDGGTGLEFCNDLVRGQAYLAVPLTLRQLLHGRVADELVRRSERGEPADGLDIAWHCIRSGRSEQAMHYLLEGARSAIRRGAVHEAEFRLGSALDLFSGERKAEAVLILTELLQEQARWDESMQMLARSADAKGSVRGRILAAITSVLTASATPEAVEDASDLAQRTLLYSAADDATTVQARRLCSSLTLTYLRCSPRAAELTAAVQATIDRQPSVAARADAVLEYAKMTFTLGCDRDIRINLLKQMEEAALSERAADLPSWRSYSMLLGVAVLRGSLGDFQGEVAPAKQALHIAGRLENRELLRNALHVLAASASWSGDPQKQLEYAGRGVALSPASIRRYDTVALHYLMAQALVQLGRQREAAELTRDLESRIAPEGPEWLKHARLLYEADLRSMLGAMRAALELSQQAVEAIGTDRIPDLISGSYARSLARLILTGARAGVDSADDLRARLVSEYEQIGKKEYSEQVEVSAALLQVCSSPHESENCRHALTSLVDGNWDGALSRLSLLGTPVDGTSEWERSLAS